MNLGSFSDYKKFNVVSCGYILSAIEGSDPKDHWEECMQLDTVKFV